LKPTHPVDNLVGLPPREAAIPDSGQAGGAGLPPRPAQKQTTLCCLSARAPRLAASCNANHALLQVVSRDANPSCQVWRPPFIHRQQQRVTQQALPLEVEAEVPQHVQHVRIPCMPVLHRHSYLAVFWSTRCWWR
jgi:hypothetical protein